MATAKRTREATRDSWGTTALVLAVVTLLAAPSEGSAQSVCRPVCPPGPVIAGAAPVPFGPGERADYDIDVGWTGGGEGYLAVHAIDTVAGHPTYHVSLYMKGSVFAVFRLEDLLQSWVDVRGLMSRRFEQEQDEVNYERHRRIEFHPESLSWAQVSPTDPTDVQEIGDLPSGRPLDELSFFFFARTLPLEVGAEYTYDDYWKEDGNPVVLQVLRKDTVKVPAGTFATIVVRPIIQSGGLFGKGGRAEIHFSDDEYRRVVYMKVRLANWPDLTMKLTEYTPGARVRSLETDGSGLSPAGEGGPARDSGPPAPFP